MGKYVDIYDHPKLNQVDVNHFYRSVTINEVEAAIMSIPKNSPGPDGFTAEFCQTLKEELMLTLLKFFHEIEREGTLPNSFYEASITLISKVDKETTRTKKRITN
jgi:hypothetical protein